MSKNDDHKPDTGNYTGKHGGSGKAADQSQGRQSGGAHSKGNADKGGKHGGSK